MSASSPTPQLFAALGPLDPGDLAAIKRRLSEPVRLARGVVLFPQGGPPDSLYFIESGEIAIRKVGDGPEARPIVTLTPGALFGEVGVLLSQPRLAEAAAASEAELWQINRSTLEAGTAAGERWATHLLLLVSRQLAQRLTDMDRQAVALFAQIDTGIGVSSTRPIAELERLRTLLFEHWAF